MTPLLTRGNHRVLETLVRRRALLGFDFDGTLVPIVADRHHVALHAETRQLLKQVAQRYPCALISGRSLETLRRLVDGIGFQFLVGNHGAESSFEAPREHAALATVRGWHRALRARFTGLPGIEIEDKRWSLSVHYRRAHRPHARRTILRACQRLEGARLVGGKMVINVMLATAATKGAAMLTIRRRARREVALFVGDDLTDEDVFRLRRRWPELVTVGIGHKASAAQYCLRRQSEIDDLLRRLLGQPVASP